MWLGYWKFYISFDLGYKRRDRHLPQPKCDVCYSVPTLSLCLSSPRGGKGPSSMNTEGNCCRGMEPLVTLFFLPRSSQTQLVSKNYREADNTVDNVFYQTHLLRDGTLQSILF